MKTTNQVKTLPWQTVFQCRQYIKNVKKKRSLRTQLLLNVLHNSIEYKTFSVPFDLFMTQITNFQAPFNDEPE